MGGCATKPKVLKGDEAEAPPPPVQKEEEPEKVGEDDLKKDEIIAAEKDNSNRNRSLGNLFMESEEEKDSGDNETVKPSDFPHAELQEPVKTNSAEEPTRVADATVEGGAEKAPEVASIFKKDSPEEKKKEEVKPAVKFEIAVIPVEKPVEKFESPEEKKTEGPELAVKIQNAETLPEEVFETPDEKRTGGAKSSEVAENMKTHVQKPEENIPAY